MSSAILPAVFPYLLAIAGYVYCIDRLCHSFRDRNAFYTYTLGGFLCPVVGAFAAALLVGEGWKFGIGFFLAVLFSGAGVYLIYLLFMLFRNR